MKLEHGSAERLGSVCAEGLAVDVANSRQPPGETNFGHCSNDDTHGRRAEPGWWQNHFSASIGRVIDL